MEGGTRLGLQQQVHDLHDLRAQVDIQVVVPGRQPLEAEIAELVDGRHQAPTVAWGAVPIRFYGAVRRLALRHLCGLTFIGDSRTLVLNRQE